MENIGIINEILEKNIKYVCNELIFKEEECDLNIMYLNIQSIRNKLDDLNTIVEKNKNNNKTIHVIALSEIWIYENENTYYNLPNYNVYIANRESNRAGGCLMFIHESLNSTLLSSIEFEKSSFLTVKLLKVGISITCVYRNCSSDVASFINTFENEILQNKSSIIVGDFNINMLNNTNETISYVSSIYSNGFVCLNSLNEDMFTRKRNSIGTIIDHIITDLINSNFSISLDDNPISDHRIISIAATLKKKLNSLKKQNTIDIFDYRKFEEQGLINECIRKSSFSDFHNALCNSINKHTIQVKKLNKKYRNPWMDNELFELIENKNKFYKLKAKYESNIYFEKEFKTLKVKVRNKINFLKKQYYGNQIEQNIHSSNKTWLILKELMLNKKATNFSDISQIKYNNKLVTNNTEMANSFNEYFTTVVEIIENVSYTDEPVTGIIQPFSLDECDSLEVENVIKNLNPKSANGPDGISSRFVKKYKEFLIGPLVKYINECFKNGHYPDELKIGSVIPIHKTGSKEICSNYRPITKLSTIDKIFQNIILNRLKFFLKANNIISQNQYGFVENSSTLSACLSCTEFIYDNLDKKNM